MAAQSTDRARPRYGEKNNKPMHYPMTAATIVKNGTLVVLASGLAKEGTEATGLIAVGVARKRCDNSAGGAAAKYVEVDEGDFPFDNSTSGDLLANADIGNDVYIVNNNQVAKTDNSAARSKAGKLVGFFSDGRPVVRIENRAK